MTSFGRSIRYSALALIVVLVATFSIGVYWGFNRVLHRYVDSRLQAIAESWAGIVEHNSGALFTLAETTKPDVPPESPVRDDQLGLREAALSILVLALDGTEVWKGDAAVVSPKSSAESLRKVHDGAAVFDTVHTPEGSLIRRISIPIRLGGEVRYVLQAVTSLRMIENALTGLLASLLVASGLSLALAWFGSGWLARKALTPVEALSATAQKISEQSLGTRLSLDAPYEEFTRLAQTFNTMMDRLQKVFEAQRRFVADAAHEIQTPLTVLKGNLDVAFRKNRKAVEYREVLISNLDAVERLINLSRSLITLARLSGHEVTAPTHPLALEPLMRELLSEFSVLADDRRITLSLDAHPVRPVPAHEDQIKRLLVNLLANALRYTSAEGAVTLQLRPADDGVMIAVRDDGQGIASEHLPHIFDRFYRVDSARARDSGGVGLGLAIAKEIVAAHRGWITVESELGKGSVFIVWLPASLNSLYRTED